MHHSHSRRSSSGRSHRKSTTKRQMKFSSANAEVDRLAHELAHEWCFGRRILSNDCAWNYVDEDVIFVRVVCGGNSCRDEAAVSGVGVVSRGER